jgi:archaellum component FlaC
MAAMNAINIQQAETEIAVLKVQVGNIEEKIGELKEDVKDVHDALEKHSEDHSKMIKDMQTSSTIAHKEMSDKISSLEKWRWMMMGAGVVLGALGHNVWGSLLK